MIATVHLGNEPEDFSVNLLASLCVDSRTSVLECGCMWFLFFLIKKLCSNSPHVIPPGRTLMKRAVSRCLSWIHGK